MKFIFKDRLTFLTKAAAKIDTLEKQLFEYLRGQFDNKNWFFSKKNIFGQLIHVVKEVTNLAFYYMEDTVVENNVHTMSKEVSIRHWAAVSGHNPVRAISARGNMGMKFLPMAAARVGRQVMIRRFAQLRNDLNALIYLVNIPNDNIILSTDAKMITLPLIEGVLQQQTFVADGSKLFTIPLDDINPIEHYEIRIYVNDELWTKEESLYDMGTNTKGYTITTSLVNQVDIIFGTGIQGVLPKNGDIIRVEYLTSRGEIGNFLDNEYPSFEFVSGVFDMQGNSIDINEIIELTKIGGFELASNGEDFETTRAVIGWNSRSMVLAIDENFEAYLSRLSFLSRITAIKDPENTAVKKLLLLPNVRNKIRSYSDYLNLDPSQFVLTTGQQTAIQEMLENSKRSFITNEVMFVNPTVKTYTCMIYINSNEVVLDKVMFKEQVCNIVIDYILSKTFAKNIDQPIISKTELATKLHNEITNLIRVSILFISRENEEAKIRGWYNKITTENNVGTTIKRTVRIDLAPTDDPMLGFNLYGDIEFDPQFDLPVIAAGFPAKSSDGNTYTLVEPISVILDDGITQETI